MRIVALILWLLLLLCYWLFSKQCCPDTSNNEISSEQIIGDEAAGETDINNELMAEAEAIDGEEDDAAQPEEDREIEEVAELGQRVITKLTPIGFNKSSADPIMDAKWVAFRDSLISALGDDQKLQIEGSYFGDESFDGEGNLGLARAKNVLKLFTNLPEERSEITGKLKGPEWLKDEVNNLIAFRFLRFTKKIKEIDNKALIYFNFNSTRQITDPEIEAYLKDVADRVKASSEKIRLTGHTDSLGGDASNRRLGEWRAESLRDKLVQMGVPTSRVQVRSMGESAPIASNSNEAGRKQNRRVELQIIK